MSSVNNKHVILGITAFNHDASAALIKNDALVAFAEEERFNGQKHTASFPSGAIAYCLSEADITAKDITDVAFYFNLADCWLSYVKHNNLFYALFDPSVFMRKRFIYEFVWLVNFSNQVKSLKRLIGNPAVKVHYVRHHDAHSWYGFYAGGMDDAIVLSNDSVGESVSTLGVQFTHNKDTIESKVLLRQKDPHSLGYLYGAVTDYLGFKRGEGEGRVMALASFGSHIYSEYFKGKIILLKNGRFKLNRHLIMNRSFAPRGQRLHNDVYRNLGPRLRGDHSMTQRHYDISYGIQHALESTLDHQVSYLRQFGKKIILVGGVAQNSVANGILKDTYTDTDIIVPPIPHDAGCAIGAAVFVNYNNYTVKTRSTDTGKLGPQYSNDHIIDLLKNAGIRYRIIPHNPTLVAEILAQDKTIIFFRGRMESGPRALCNRSIIASPKPKDMRDHLNEHIKYRESFRPYGGFMLPESLDVVLHHPNVYKTGPYMSFVYKVRGEWKDKMPSLVHVDGTCRVQVVETDDYLKKLLKAFNTLTGVPVLINTSLNLRGQPIARTPADAVSVFYTSAVDYLLFNETILIEKVQDE